MKIKQIGNVTQALKCELWDRYGNPANTENKAEWDGKIFGGGKLSQRYWEYFKTIENLNLTHESVVLDIGGYTAYTGQCFFAELLAEHVAHVYVIDPSIVDEKVSCKATLLKSVANYVNLKAFLEECPDITHISCVSVFEHIDHETRVGIVKAINEVFQGKGFATTLEYHPFVKAFEEQLTAQSLGELFAPFTNFYCERMDASPTHCTNAYISTENPVPLWYPLALNFVTIKQPTFFRGLMEK